MTDALLTPQDMAARLGVPASTVMQWNREKSWPHVRAGRRYRWTEDQYDQIVRGLTVTATSAASPVAGQTARSAARGQAASA